LALLSANETALSASLDAKAAKGMDLPLLEYTEAGFRFALNEDAMATEKLAEGIRAFCVDAIKLEGLMLAAQKAT
jgi:transaldolase